MCACVCVCVCVSHYRAQEVDSATLREELFTMSVTQLKETLETFNLSTSVSTDTHTHTHTILTVCEDTEMA